MIRIGIYATLFVAWTAFTVVSGMFWVVSVVSGLLATYFTVMWVFETLEWLHTPPNDLKQGLLYLSSAVITAMQAVVWMHDFVPLSTLFGALCIVFLHQSHKRLSKWRLAKRLYGSIERRRS